MDADPAAASVIVVAVASLLHASSPQSPTRRSPGNQRQAARASPIAWIVTNAARSSLDEIVSKCAQVTLARFFFALPPVWEERAAGRLR
jgi:hypothetical protein